MLKRILEKPHSLLIAAENRNFDTVQLLLNAGANVNHKNKSGNSALSMALHNKRTQIVRLLQQHMSKI